MKGPAMSWRTTEGTGFPVFSGNNFFPLSYFYNPGYCLLPLGFALYGPIAFSDSRRSIRPNRSYDEL